jgi:hypothetical protein
MTDDAGTPQPKTSPQDPPAANQNQDEPVPTTPDESAQAGDPGSGDESASPGARKQQVPDAEDGVGEAHGVPVASTYAVGSSGEGVGADGGIPVLRRAGKPDGEVDTGA